MLIQNRSTSCSRFVTSSSHTKNDKPKPNKTRHSNPYRPPCSCSTVVSTSPPLSMCALADRVACSLTFETRMKEAAYIFLISILGLAAYSGGAYVTWLAILRGKTSAEIERKFCFFGGVAATLFVLLVSCARFVLMPDVRWYETIVGALFTAIVFAINYWLVVFIERRNSNQSVQRVPAPPP